MAVFEIGRCGFGGFPRRAAFGDLLAAPRAADRHRELFTMSAALHTESFREARIVFGVLISVLMKFLACAILVFVSAAFAQAPDSTAPATSQPTSSEQDSSVKAKKLVQQAIDALGGNAYLNIEDITQEGRTYSFHHGQSNSVGVLYWRFTKFPDKERIELTKKRDVIYVYNGDKGYEITYKGTAATDATAMADYLRRREYSLEWVLRRWLKEPGVALFYDGPAIAEQKPAEQVTIMNARNEAVDLYIDPDSHLPIKKSFSWRDPKDKERNVEEEVFDNYRPVQGIMTPFSVTRFYNGDMANQRFLNSVSYNQNLNDSLFAASISYDPNRLPGKK
jgi:hypothetical protein